LKLGAELRLEVIDCLHCEEVQDREQTLQVFRRNLPRLGTIRHLALQNRCYEESVSVTLLP
jgi:hypothetical protein